MFVVSYVGRSFVVVKFVESGFGTCQYPIVYNGVALTVIDSNCIVGCKV